MRKGTVAALFRVASAGVASAGVASAGLAPAANPNQNSPTGSDIETLSYY